MNELSEFRNGLETHLAGDPYARPFVCTGSPLKCRSFIVGLNAATRLNKPFLCYWSDSIGFDREKFDSDYRLARPRRGGGNRPPIEAIANQIAPCLETNLYATPTRKAAHLTEGHRRDPVVSWLFHTIQPELVFVHSNEAIHFFACRTGCRDVASDVKRTHWQGHDFWLFGRPGPLYTLGVKQAGELGAMLANYLER